MLFAPALLTLAVILLCFGPDPNANYDREYEQEPPTNTPPALVPPLLRRAVTPEAPEFTATIFDLVRRGYFTARSMPVEGAGETLDLELAGGNRAVPLADFEVPVAKIVDGVVADGPILLSALRDRLDEQSENVLRFDAFREQVKRDLEARGWYAFTAARALLLASLAFLVAGMAGSALLYSLSRTATFYYGAAMIDGAGLLFHASWITKLIRRRRRTPAGQLEAKRWEAFRRFLVDFPRLHDAPSSSLELWERYLVHAIALGLAPRVLAGAEAYRLEELSRSPLFWLGLQGAAPGGELDVYSELAREVAPTRAGRVQSVLRSHRR